MEEKKHDENEDQFEKDEDYGLPDVSYEPVNREDENEPIIMNPRENPSQKHKEDSSWPLIIGIFIVLILAVVLVYFFFIKEEAPAVQQTPPPVVEEIPEPEEFIVEEDYNWDPPVEEPAVVEPTVGVMTDISARTGRAYIIVGSFIDVDLAHDYGNKLAGEGVSTVVIAPYGNVKYYRLSVADFASVGDALANLDQYKSKYGDNIWVLKY